MSLSPFHRSWVCPCPEGHVCTLQGPWEGASGWGQLTPLAVLISQSGQARAVETCGCDTNGSADLCSLDGGPHVHLRHIFQVPRTEADSVLDNKRCSVGGIILQHEDAAGTSGSWHRSRTSTGSQEITLGVSWLVRQYRQAWNLYSGKPLPTPIPH